MSDTIAVIDCETLSTTPNTVVLSLAITHFTINDPAKPLTLATWGFNTKSWNLKIDAEIQNNRDIDESTTNWWNEQSDEAKEAHRQEPLIHPKPMLEELNTFIADNKIDYICANGINFDGPILDSLYRQYGVKPALPFWATLDLRTMKWLAPTIKVPFPKELTPHIAAHDTIYEAMVFRACLANIRG